MWRFAQVDPNEPGVYGSIVVGAVIIVLLGLARVAYVLDVRRRRKMSSAERRAETDSEPLSREGRDDGQ